MSGAYVDGLRIVNVFEVSLELSLIVVGVRSFALWIVMQSLTSASFKLRLVMA